MRSNLQELIAEDSDRVAATPRASSGCGAATNSLNGQLYCHISPYHSKPRSPPVKKYSLCTRPVINRNGCILIQSQEAVSAAIRDHGENLRIIGATESRSLAEARSTFLLWTFRAEVASYWWWSHTLIAWLAKHRNITQVPSSPAKKWRKLVQTLFTEVTRNRRQRDAKEKPPRHRAAHDWILAGINAAQAERNVVLADDATPSLVCQTPDSSRQRSHARLEHSGSQRFAVRNPPCSRRWGPAGPHGCRRWRAVLRRESLLNR